MVGGWSDRFVSSECASEHHDDCYHVHGGQLFGAPRPHYLCRCDCHQDCVLARSAPSGIGLGTCTCPGMIALRAADRRTRRRQAPSPGNSVGVLLAATRHARDERRKRREVDQILLASAPGRSREDVRAMMIEQYERLGLPVHPQPLLDYKADMYREQDPEERARIRAEMGAVLREEVAPLIQMAKHMFAPRRDP